MWRKVVAAIPKGSFARRIVAVGGGTAVGQALVFLTTPALTRIYGPEEMVLLGLMLAFITPATILLSFRFDLAVTVSKDDQDSATLLTMSMLLVPITSMWAGGVLYLLIRQRVAGFDALPLWAVAASVGLLAFTGVFTCLRSLCVRRAHFRAISVALIQQGMGRAIVPLMLALVTNSWWGLLAGEAAGRMLGIHGLYSKASDTLAAGFRRISWASIRDCASRYGQFPRIILPSSMLDALSSAIQLPIFVTTYGAEAGGAFFLAQRVVLAPALLVSASVADVFQHHILEAARRDKAQCRAEVGRAALRLVSAGLCIYLPVAFMAPKLSAFVFGNRWNDVGVLIACLVPAAVSAIVTNPLGRSITLSTVPQVKFLADIVRLILPVAAIVWAGHAQRGVLEAAFLFAVATLVGDACYFLAILYAVSPSRLRQVAG